MSALMETYSGRRVLITGHTGFKGSWLALWLDALGAQVAGVALDPNTRPNHWEQLRLSIRETRLDIRSGAELSALARELRPEVVFHLAAQPLVRRSYADPYETWSTNVVGTVNVLEACRQVPELRAIVVVTSDKCYDNQEWVWGYRESDRLGGHDPYSASKAATELVAASYRSSFFSRADSPLVATVRAGNVIGGGDWSSDRLLPDVARAVTLRTPMEIRSPHATRPWQHVLDPLHGYLMLGARLLAGERAFADAWNFGPNDTAPCSVLELLNKTALAWPEVRWSVSAGAHPREAGQLNLDSSKARQLLGWKPIWDLDRSVGATTEWYRRYIESSHIASREQLQHYTSDAGYND